MFVTLKLFLISLAVSGSINIAANEIEEDKTQNYTFLIMGGYRPAKHTLSKYIVSLRTGRSRKYRGDNHFCGGSIITPKVVLTAAHCAVDQTYEEIPHVSVVAGSPYLHLEIQSSRTYKVERILVHPTFSFTTLRSDLALLFLEREIEQNDDTISVVPIADQAPESGTKCVTYGWGRLFPHGPRPVELVYVNLSLLKRRQCSKYHPMNPTIICAGDEKDWEKGPYEGDSGGPLLCKGKLTGVTSFVYHTDQTPTYFGNVYEHRKWILKNITNSTRLYSFNFLIIVFLFIII